MGNCDAEIDCEVDCVIDQILREDRLESMGLDPRPDPCEPSHEGVDQKPGKNCAVETSARFSIRILEALRAVQRQKATHAWSSCSMEEVVRYIRRNYNYDGDLCSQVETALDQVSAQGFVLKMGANRYHLTGPFACSVPKPPTIGGCNRNRPNCGPPRPARGRRRRRGSIANSTLANLDCPAPFSLDRLSTVSEIEDPGSAEFQDRRNREISLIRDDGRPVNEDQELSILEEIPIRRPGEAQGFGQVAGGHSLDEHVDEIHPPAGVEPRRRNGGGGGRGNVVVRDHIFDGNLEEIYPPAGDGRGELARVQSDDENVGQIENPLLNAVVRRANDCGAEEHSSDENMYCNEPGVNNTQGSQRRQCPAVRRRRRRSDSSSSRSYRDTVNSRSPARRSRRSNFDCSSDADVSDDTDVGELEVARPWVRRCQYQNSRVQITRRGRRCSSCVYD